MCTTSEPGERMCRAGRPDRRPIRDHGAVAEAQELLREAIEREGEGYQRLLEGQPAEAAGPLREASNLYRRSWEAAPPSAYGRLIGTLKTALIAGEPADEAASYVREAVGDEPQSEASAYALSLAALVQGDDELAARAAEVMGAGSDAFGRTARAIAALAGGDRDAYEQALRAIVEDFERRSEHLTGVPIADTALALERLAERRGIAVHPRSTVLPPAEPGQASRSERRR
jgi:hypothetical protein